MCVLADFKSTSGVSFQHRVSSMSEGQMNLGRAESKMSALLAMLKYVREELDSVDTISQFCVDMAIEQLSERARSLAIFADVPNADKTIQ